MAGVKLLVDLFQAEARIRSCLTAMNCPEFRTMKVPGRLKMPRETAAQQGSLAIFSFPKGAASGIFFHDILEHLDFSNQDLTYRQALVRSKLSAYGFDPSWVDVLVLMLENLSTVTSVT